MPPKRKTAENDTSNHLNEVSIGRPELVPPATRPAPVKRQRVSRACDQCRSARERCDGKQPECYTCISQGRPCTYEVNPKKRGVQTGYIRTLELALGWVLEKVAGSEDALGAFLAHESSQGHPILTGKDPGRVDSLQKRWRESRVLRGIDRILSGGTVPSPGPDGVSPSVDATDTEGDAVRACLSTDSADGGAETAIQRPPDPRQVTVGHGPSDVDQQRDTPLSLMQGHPSPRPDHLRLPPNHWRLLDIYFSYTHSWLPILDKQGLFQASYLYPEHGLVVNPDDISSAAHAELWAALALASLQDDASSSLDVTGPPSPSPLEIYQVARGLLPPERGRFLIQHARALLLLSLVNLGHDKLVAAGLLTGFAVRILLDSDTGQRGAQAKDRERTNLALMACFMLETVLSVRCNKPPHLRAEDLAGLPLVSESGLDQWEPWTPCDGFGSYCAESRSSRSPAFCLSTFNQLYAILKVVASETLARRRGLSPQERPGPFIMQLHQAIDPNLPFRSFITSPSCGTASVPTPYVARATYLWACALADPRSETFLPMLQDTLDQYQQRFGKCGMPPFLSTCIGFLANEQNLPGPSEQNKEILIRLASGYTTVGSEARPSGIPDSHAEALSQKTRAHEPPDMTASLPFTAPSNAYAALVMPSLSDGESAARRLRPHPSRGGYTALPGPSMAGSYQSPLQNHSMTAPPQQGRDIHMHLGTDVASVPGMTGSVVSTHQGHTHTPPHPLVSHTGFGTSPDYDALLDDLAAIECTDTIDVDPQFMTNLGFAPGCDITEILTRDFGPV
ncbi:hypothetical protein C8A03DRAFT_45538 [Achaetomium macrosporum]|uniref:Zn(2)-C6 fungal-type domain-containing protein n=1 Tax=Achaetomium macrosporum TaxID=79813 RepID=A0AAN7C8R4_9PEZI|nr:hypothetical protein C8A03DRAFT_45538 [Achaetomium macrosporum]